MLVFSSDQLAGLEKSQARDFRRDISYLCRESLPGYCAYMSAEDLDREVQRSLHIAAEAGLTWQSNLATACLLDLRYRCSVLHNPTIQGALVGGATPDHGFRGLFDARHAGLWDDLE